MLNGPERPIAVMVKRDPSSHREISNLHTLGCMLPYTGLHHLLFHYLNNPLLDHDERKHARVPDGNGH